MYNLHTLMNNWEKIKFAKKCLAETDLDLALIGIQTGYSA